MDAFAQLLGSLGDLWQSYGLISIFVVMLLKEIGVPIPVPGDVLMITAGAAAALGQIDLTLLLLSITLAAIVGGWIQYVLARGPGRAFIYRFGPLLGLTRERLDRASRALSNRGWPSIALARFTPGLRIVCILGCGLAAVPYATFIPALILGSIAFIAFHVLLGFTIGPLAISLLTSATIPLLLGVGVFLGLGLIIWWAKGRRERTTTAQTLSSWAEGACPVCLIIGQIPEKITVN
ncbi:MAG: DedA family protein [Chloroflexi bacterium]|nr:DedA family protein [Chloroflexota bacterium]